MKIFFMFLLKIVAIFVSIALILYALKLCYIHYKGYQFSKTLPPITRPIRNTNYKEKTTVTFSGGYARMYQADVPNEFIRYDRGYPVSLWLTYPDFKGHTPYFNDPTVDRTKIVHFDLGLLGGIDDFPEEQLQARYGQKGVQALFDTHWKLTHTPSEQQPYGNPKEYFVNWNPELKDYIYDAGDYAIRIDCMDEYAGSSCQAYKRWENTPIVIKYSFDKSLLADFGRIQAEIDKLLHTFNIRENSHYYPQKEMAFRKRTDTPTFSSCHPQQYDVMLDAIEAIIASDKNKKWQKPEFINVLIQEYIPVGCSLNVVIRRFTPLLFRRLDNPQSINVEQKNLPESNEVILKIPLFNTKYFYWFRPTFWLQYFLEIKITHKGDQIDGVTAQIKQTNFTYF
jgi:hypothetical protein